MKVAAECKKLAKLLGCELDVVRRSITIHLPEGMQIAGNPGLNIRVNDSETLTDSWEMTLRDLRELADEGMEPFEDPDELRALVKRRARHFRGIDPDETPRAYVETFGLELIGWVAAATCLSSQPNIVEGPRDDEE